MKCSRRGYILQPTSNPPHKLTKSYIRLYWWSRTDWQIIKGKIPNYTIELSQESNSQSSTTKLDNIGHSTIEIRQIWPLGKVVLYFKEILIRSKKSKLIHFKSEKIETSTNFFLKI